MMSVAPLAGSAWAQSDEEIELDTLTVRGEQTVQGDTLPPAYAGGQVAAGGRLGILGEGEAADVPFNVIGFTETLIENQQADTLADVLQNDASVQSGFGYGNYAEKFMIRGFELDGEDISYGGLYGVLPRQVIDTSLAGRVELFKGANAFTNGVAPGGSGVGGAINIEPKRATDAPINEIFLGYESDSYGEVGLDMGRRFGAQNQYGIRANVERGRGDTAIDDEERRSTAAAVGLDYRGERARASLDVGYQKQQIEGGRSVVYVDSGLTGIPDAPDADTNYAAGWSHSSMETTFGMLRGEYDVSGDWTAYAAIGGNNTHEDGLYASPTVNDTSGDGTIGQLDVPYRASSVAGQAGVRGQLDTGSVSHQLNLGYSGVYRKTRSAYEMIVFTPSPTNIYDPATVPLQEPDWADGDMSDPSVRSRTRANGVALSDTLGFLDDRVLLTLGTRYQEVEVTNYTYEGDFDSRFSDYAVSPLYGLVIKPTENISLYVNHIEALQPGDTAPATAINSGQSIGIVESEQNEIGVKFDTGTLGATLSVFEIERPEAFLDPDTLVYGYHGEQRNRGVEVSLYGEIVPGVRLLSSAMWLDPEITHAEDEANAGNDAVGVPGYRYVLGGEWDIPHADGWTASGRVIRNGSQYVDAANELEVDAWTRLDLGVRYRMPLGDSALTWRANVENVTGEDYWASAGGGYLTQGEPRTVKLSAELAF